jgi:hypothetical protein
MSAQPPIGHKATVTSASPLKVKPFGATRSVPARRLTTYSAPAVNDVVAYILFDGGILVLGKWA